MNSQTRQILNLLVEKKISLDETERLLELVNSRTHVVGYDIKSLIAHPEMAIGSFDRQSINKFVPRIDMGNIYPYI